MPTAARHGLSPAGSDRGASDRAPRLSFWLLSATGLAVPLYAFPPLMLAGRPVDLAVLFAAAFLLLNLPALLRSLREDRARALLAAAAALVPLLALIPPRDPTFSLEHFVLSLVHWGLVIGFFLAAGARALGEGDRQRFLRINLVAGIVVAAFAAYQAFGHVRGWPGAGPRLLAMQWAPFRLLGHGDYVRPSSFFLEPGYMGGYLAWIALIALVTSAAEGRGGRSLLPVAGFSCAVFGVTMSLSWGAYADLLAVLCAAALIIPRLPREARRRLRPLGGGLAAVLLVAALTPLPQALVGRIARLSQTPLDPAAPVREPDSLRARVVNLQHTFSLFRSEPLKGIGLGQFALRTGAREGSVRESPWCGWAAAAALLGVLGPFLVAAGPLLVLRVSACRPGLLVAGTLALAAVDQIHTASFVDLRWWFPLASALFLSGRRG